MQSEVVAKTEDEFLALVAQGESAASACRAVGRSTHWSAERATRHPEFRARLAEAREAGRQARQERVTSIAFDALAEIVEKPRVDPDTGRPLLDEDGEEIWELDLTPLQERILLKLLGEKPAPSVNVGVSVDARRDAPTVVPSAPSGESATDKARRLLGEIEIEDATVVE